MASDGLTIKRAELLATREGAILLSSPALCDCTLFWQCKKYEEKRKTNFK